MAMEDSMLNGYHIPKGSMIMTNLWCCRWFLLSPRSFFNDVMQVHAA
jgi:hypothetical protein